MFTTKNLLLLIGRNALISLAAVCLALIFIFFLAKQIKRVSENAALNQRLEMQLEKRTELLEILKKDAQIIGTNDILIKNSFVPSDNILEFINILDSLAAKIGVTQTYRFETPTESAISASFPISTISYSNSLGANVVTFLNYLKEFEKLPYFTNIDGFNIASQSALGWLEASSITLRATLYTKTIQ